MFSQQPPTMKDEEALRQRPQVALRDLVSQWPQPATAEQKQKAESEQNRAQWLHSGERPASGRTFAYRRLSPNLYLRRQSPAEGRHQRGPTLYPDA